MMGYGKISDLTSYALLILAIVAIPNVPLTPVFADTPVSIDARDSGRIFDGIGALSAGASSRLLIDYPTKQRNEILDYLFKPNFGAALQINKVEIGGDTNSTDGSEPSHMHTPDDQNYTRGYEWWLMRESKKRNPAIKLYALEWGTPSWINPKENNVWTENNINYILDWLDHAKSDYGLTIDYIGGWNERGNDKNWYRSFHSALQNHGYSNLKVVGDDSFNWNVGREAHDDSAFAGSFDIIGQHYPGYAPDIAQNPDWQASLATGKPLWGSEIGSERYDTGAGDLAKMYNRGYIAAKMTAFINWSTVWSVYPTLTWPGAGLMLADEPWSGHYIPARSIWATAHTTQFAKPGWQYLDHACGYFGGAVSVTQGASSPTGAPADGSFVTLRSPNGRDYSVVAETVDASGPQSQTFIVTGGLSTGPLHVWRTDLRSSRFDDWFVRQRDIKPINGQFTVTCSPGCVYSFTTTTGQAKGVTSPPKSGPFPIPYHDTFQGYALDKTPRFFSDQQGTFEIAPSRGRDGKKCLRQVVTARPVEWADDGDPSTLIGDPRWEDYEVSTDVLLEQPGYADLVGRMMGITGSNNSNVINGYHLRLTDQGRWSLIIKHHDDEKVLAEGNITARDGEAGWHSLSLRFDDDKITARIDGAAVAKDIVDDTYPHGQAGYEVSRWINAEFMNFVVTPVDGNAIPDSHVTATATSFQPGYEPANAIGHGSGSFWHTAYAPKQDLLPQSITLDLGRVATVKGLRYLPRQDGQANGRITDYRVLVSMDARSFTPVAAGTWPDDGESKVARFDPVTCRYVRLEAVAGHGGFASAAYLRVIRAR
jgi:O-glycosyl hydrolase